jgi:hypothetical protein
MHLRHIRPGSVDWNDATFEEKEGKLELSPEEKDKLRRIGQPEPATLTPLLHSPAAAHF